MHLWLVLGDITDHYLWLTCAYMQYVSDMCAFNHLIEESPDFDLIKNRYYVQGFDWEKKMKLKTTKSTRTKILIQPISFIKSRVIKYIFQFFFSFGFEVLFIHENSGFSFSTFHKMTTGMKHKVTLIIFELIFIGQNS